MKEVTIHATEKGTPPVRVFREGDVGNGNAYFNYCIGLQQPGARELGTQFRFKFQQGDPAQQVNGVTDEALLAIVIDRLEMFEAGEFHCLHNEVALGHLRQALWALQARTLDRKKRGVEGKQQA